MKHLIKEYEWCFSKNALNTTLIHFNQQDKHIQFTQIENHKTYEKCFIKFKNQYYIARLRPYVNESFIWHATKTTYNI